MMSFIFEYLIFLAKLFSFVLAILITTAGIFSIARKAKEQNKDKLCIQKLNKKFQEFSETLNAEILTKKAFRKYTKEQKMKRKKNANQLKKRFLF